MPAFNRSNKQPQLQILYWLQLFSVLFLGGYLCFFSQWHVETNLLSILPSTLQHQNFKPAEVALFKKKSQQIVVLVSGKESLSAYRALEARINNFDKVSVLELPEPSLSSIAKFYLPYRNNFLSQSYLGSIANAQELSQLANNQLLQLANPFVSATISNAPRLNLADYLQQALSNLTDIEVYQSIGTINAQQQQYLIMRLQLSLDSFDLEASQLTAEKLQQVFGDITTQYEVKLNYSGILFHTAESTTQAKAEISSFGVFSIVAVILLIIVVFRSLIPLTGALVVLSIASIYGFVAILLFFDSLHILTLVFAVTLVGVVVDYCFHAFVYANEQSNDTDKSNTISKPLILGFVTTAMGYVVLIFSPLSLLSQVAVFMIFGLFGALITVLVLLPYFNGKVNITKSPKAILFSERGVIFFKKIERYNSAVMVLLLCFLSTYYLINPIQFNDDVRLLNSSPKWLIDQEIKTAKILNYNNAQRIMVKSNSPQKLLALQEQIIETLLTTQPTLKIRGIYELLPSIKKQKEHYSKLTQSDQQGNFKDTLALTGLSDPIISFKPLSYEEFSQGPFAFILQLYMAKFNIESDAKGDSVEYALWLDVSEETLSDANVIWLNNNINASLYDPAGEVSLALAQYRIGVLELLISAFAVVMVILVIKYGVIAGALSAFATIGSALFALMMTQIISTHLNIFNLLAVLLIIALAIDYVIFYQEKGLMSKTFLSICLSAASSAAVFGILVFSTTPAVSSFGLTVMIGIVSIFILAPISVINNNKF